MQTKEIWEKNHTGLSKSRMPIIADNGAKVTRLDFKADESQLMESRSFQVEDICRFYGVPPHMVGLVDKSSSWGAGIAEQTAGFSTFTLARHITRFEHAINKFLLRRELTDHYCKFELGGLLRGTLLQRYQAYAIGYGRFLSTNDIRRKEDMPPVEGGDAVLGQSQYVPIDELTKVGAMPPAAPAPDQGDGEEESPT